MSAGPHDADKGLRRSQTAATAISSHLPFKGEHRDVCQAGAIVGMTSRQNSLPGVSGSSTIVVLMTSCRISHPIQVSATFCLMLAWCVLTVADLCAQQRPLQTQDPAIIPPGNLSLEFGFDFLQDAKYPQSGLQGDLTSLGVIGINVGLGEIVEFQIQGTAHNFLSINQRMAAPITPILNSTGTATSDYGDLLFSTKILMVPEGRRFPSLAFRPSVQLPNASTASGLGLNSTQFYGTFIFGKHFGKLNTFANLGLGILANPIEAGIQNDVLVYGLAGLYPVTKSVNLAGEVFGRWSTRGSTAPLGTESLSQLRLGLQINSAGFRWDLAGIAGLTKTSPYSGVTFGITKEFPVFQIPTVNKSK